LHSTFPLVKKTIPEQESEAVTKNNRKWFIVKKSIEITHAAMIDQYSQ